MPPVADEPVSQKKSDTIDLFDKGGGEEEEDNLFGAPPNKVNTLTLSISTILSVQNAGLNPPLFHSIVISLNPPLFYSIVISSSSISLYIIILCTSQQPNRM